jgi:hypothetical protein
MTEATRNALEHVSRILHEAGWDSPKPEDQEITGQENQTQRNAESREPLFKASDQIVLTLKSADQIVLKIGTSYIKIDSGGITLNGTQLVQLNPTEGTDPNRVIP